MVVQSSCGSEIGSEHSHLISEGIRHLQVPRLPRSGGIESGKVSGFQERRSLKAWLGFWQSSLLESSAFMDLGSAHFLLTLKSRGNPGVLGWYLDFHSMIPNFLTPYLESNSLTFTAAAVSKFRLWTQTRKVAIRKVSTSQNKYTHTEP